MPKAVQEQIKAAPLPEKLRVKLAQAIFDFIAVSQDPHFAVEHYQKSRLDNPKYKVSAYYNDEKIHISIDRNRVALRLASVKKDLSVLEPFGIRPYFAEEDIRHGCPDLSYGFDIDIKSIHDPIATLKNLTAASRKLRLGLVDEVVAPVFKRIAEMGIERDPMSKAEARSLLQDYIQKVFGPETPLDFDLQNAKAHGRVLETSRRKL